MEAQIVPAPRAPGPNEALVNLTWAGSNYDIPDPVSVDITDDGIKAMLGEVIQAGSYGISSDQDVAQLRNFMVERDPPNQTHPYNRIVVRPKTSFGR